VARARKKNKTATAKLLDAWRPPEGAGVPIGCVATSFTFSPVFFEEECLGRFLQLQSDAVEEAPLYVIEREEKLADVRCVAALVDAHHCKGARSLRWDLLSARVPGAILHAKISLLHWQHQIRLIVASANLTEDGYRRNQEIFGILEYLDGGSAPLSVLDAIVTFLRQAVSFAAPKTNEAAPAVVRWDEFLDGVVDVSRTWGVIGPPAGSKQPRVHAVLTGRERPSALHQVTDAWTESVYPEDAVVTSPFFDPPGAPNKPAFELWRHLRQRGPARVAFNISAEETSQKNELFLHAPEEILKAKPNRPQTEIQIRWFREHPEDKQGAFRHLHLKSIRFEGREWIGHLIGSGNFTSAGLGLSKAPNLEANLFYLVHKTGMAKFAEQLRRAAPKGEPIGKDVKLLWQPPDETGEDAPAEDNVALPAAFGLASYDWQENEAFLTLQINGTPPDGWRVFAAGDDGALLYDHRRWADDAHPASITLPWTSEMPPSGLEVGWSGCVARAWWPVNVCRAASLPPPAELKDLPLDVLVRVLTSARPLHLVLKEPPARQKPNIYDGSTGPYDPHKAVDTSGFLLQKTYRVTAALIGLREKLQRPVASEDALAWRLHGPVGVMAVAKAIDREKRSVEEEAFLLTELALEIGRLTPATASGCLPLDRIRQAIGTVVDELRQMAGLRLDKAPDSLRRYVKTAFKEIAP
jgi:hypothetical protein